MNTESLPCSPRAGGWSLAISDGLTVDDLLRIAPVALPVLTGRGVSGNERGGFTLADVARRHEIALDELLDELRDAATDDAARRECYGVPW